MSHAALSQNPTKALLEFVRGWRCSFVLTGLGFGFTPCRPLHKLVLSTLSFALNSGTFSSSPGTCWHQGIRGHFMSWKKKKRQCYDNSVRRFAMLLMFSFVSFKFLKINCDFWFFPHTNFVLVEWSAKSGWLGKGIFCAVNPTGDRWETGNALLLVGVPL